MLCHFLIGRELERVWGALHFYAGLRGPGLQQALKCVPGSFGEFLCTPYLSTCPEERDHELQLRWGSRKGVWPFSAGAWEQAANLAASLHGKCAGPEENSLSKHFRTTQL